MAITVLGIRIAGSCRLLFALSPGLDFAVEVAFFLASACVTKRRSGWPIDTGRIYSRKLSKDWIQRI